MSFLRRSALSLLLLGLWGLAGCTAHLIMDYDPVLDQGISSVQASTEQFLSQMDAEVGTPAAAFSQNQSFYIDTDGQLRTLMTRAQSEPHSSIVVKQMSQLQQSFADLKGLHSVDGDKGLGHLEIATARSGLENQFLSLLTLQLALRNRLRTPQTTATAPTVTQ